MTLTKPNSSLYLRVLALEKRFFGRICGGSSAIGLLWGSLLCLRVSDLPNTNAPIPVPVIPDEFESPMTNCSAMV